MASVTNDVQGSALYLEFRRPNSTCQIVLMPDGVNSKNEVVFAKLFRRVVRPDAPKKRWAAYNMPPTRVRTERAKATILGGQDFTGWEEYANERMANVADYLDSIHKGGYTLVKDAVLYVEVTKADMDEAQGNSLSTKVWNRVKASRTAAGFPTTLAD